MADIALHSSPLLPKTSRPTHYDLRFEVDFSETIVKGTVVIELKTLRATDTIFLNAVDIKIIDAFLTIGGERKHSKSISNVDQVLAIESESTIPSETKVILQLRFESVLNEKTLGFYKSSYVDSDGISRYMACTQMEPVDARRVFPCYDEPGLKATFSISLTAPRDMTCLSNMDVTSEELQTGGKKLVVFAKTPLMSTYLVAMVIADLEYIESSDFRIPVRVYTIRGLSSKGQFALDLAVRTLQFYESVFDIPFPLPKMDLVAVHESFGAMEHWGLVVFETKNILFDASSGVEDKKRIASVVQHELAHQWFGNLVTMEFWDGLWLNEGFATWMSIHSANILFPEWNVWQDFITGDLQKALNLDSLRNSHPVEVPVSNTDEINQIFDAIAYSKGACVIRMLAKYLGEDIFLQGIQLYLKSHAYGNTETVDLWKSLEAASGVQLRDNMSAWTKEVGYPILTITECLNEGSICVQQDRFLQSNDVAAAENQTIYPIPLSIITAGKCQQILMDKKEMKIQLDDLGFYKLNSGHSGFYRTLYEPERLKKLGEAITTNVLSLEDRIGLIADASALSGSGYQKTSALLGMLAGFRNETNPSVWKQILACLDSIDEAFKYEGAHVQEGLQRFKRVLLGSHAVELGWDFSSDDLLSARHKAAMFEAAGEAGDPIIMAAALKMFADFQNGDSLAIHPNIRLAVFAMAIKHHGEEGRQSYQHLLAVLRTTKSPDEGRDALTGLGNTRDIPSIQQLLDLLLTDEVQIQNFYFPMLPMRRTSLGADEIWKWMQNHWEDIESKFFSSLGIFGVIVGIMIRGLVSKKRLQEVEAFFATKSTAKYEKQLALVLDSMRVNISWAGRDREDVKEWLVANNFFETV